MALFFFRDKGFQHPITSEITPRAVYEERRQLLRQGAAGLAGAALAGWAGFTGIGTGAGPGKLAAPPGNPSVVAGAVTMEKHTSYQDASSYK